MKDLVAIIDAFFHHTISATGKMQLAYKAAGVTGIGQEAADEFFRGRHGLSVLPAACGARIAASEEGSSAGCANGALAIGAGERNTLRRQRIKVWRVDQWIAQRMDGVVPLLVGADPEDVGLIRHGRWINQLANLGELCLSIGQWTFRTSFLAGKRVRIVRRSIGLWPTALRMAVGVLKADWQKME